MESLACTFTLKPVQYRCPLSKQYENVKSVLSDSPFKFSLVCEITNSGNLHMHGIIDQIHKVQYGTFKQSVVEYFRLSKVVGFICLKELTDKDGWINYCFKNYFITKKDIYFAPTVMFNNSHLFPKGLEIVNILSGMLEEGNTGIVNLIDINTL